MNKLVLAAAVSFCLMACNNTRTNKDNTAKAEQTQLQTIDNCVEILYFHGKQRCATCMAIEKNTKEAIEAQFVDELKKGTVVFRTIDISKAENEAIAEKYEVTWSSLFICKWENGIETCENLTDYAFANARTAPDTFKNGLVERINKLME